MDTTTLDLWRADPAGVAWAPDAADFADGCAVWLRLVGVFAVYRAGRIRTATGIGSRKARTLLAVLAIRPDRRTSAERLAETLWVAGTPQRPADNVATLVSRLRSTLGRDVIVGDRNGYRLGGAVRVDLHDLARVLGTAETQLSAGESYAALVAARRALTLLDDTILADHPAASWAEPAHDLHTDLLRRARHAAATAALRTGDPRAAGIVAQAAVNADPLDEAACQLLMRAHHTAGEPARALMAYQRLRATLGHELGVDPAPATRDLHVLILRHNAA